MGLGAAPRKVRSRQYDPSCSDRGRRDRRGYRRSLSPSALVDTEIGGTNSIEISGPKRAMCYDMVVPPKIVISEEISTPDGRTMQTNTVEQDFEEPPRLQLRNSFRNSFTRGSILSLGKFRVPQ